MKRKILNVMACLLIAALLAAGFSGCAGNRKSKDIIILYTNDVHCGIDDDIGYAGLAALKKRLLEKNSYVTLVDCGDHVQGSYLGAVSEGECIIDIMNRVGYDFAILGNHEFDYGMERLEANIAKAEAQYLNCNVTYTGSGEDRLKGTKPYEIVTYGKIKVAFIGVSTPWSISTSTPTHFMENGEYVYDFSAGENGQRLYDTVQQNVDACRRDGADYVVVLSHLGMDDAVDTPYSSQELIANTSGIDVVLDAHSHTEAPCWIIENKDGGDVMLSSSGTKLNNIGELVITENGHIFVGVIESYEWKDSETEAFIADITKNYEQQLNEVITHTDIDLSCSDAEGIRMVRSRELPIGDLVADAYRVIGGADIGMCNGGGIRADLSAGDITFGDIIAVNPYGNSLCVVKVTGTEILDMLEYFCRNIESDYSRDGKAFGEDGSFQQVSGIRFTVNTDIESSAVWDETDTFTGVAGERRISDVTVLKDGEYVPIDPEAVYTLASHDYMIKNGGSGMMLMLADHELVIDESIADYQVLIDYIKMLDGDLSAYAEPDGRITIK